MNATTIREPVSLEEVLRYHHPGIIRRYAKEHRATPEEAAELFRETLKWLYLCARATEHGPAGLALAVHSEIERIDWMWHTFLLFTRDYAAFCEEHFGFFIHHVPNEDEADDAPLDDASLRAGLEQQYAFVYDVLGEDTLQAWYGDCRYAAVK